MLVALQLVGVVVTPLNLTVLLPCEPPKFWPDIVIDAPTGPDAGESPVMLGGTTTVNVTPLLAKPPTVTTTDPVVAPDGTGAWILAPLQLVGVVATPLNLTVLVPCVEPKFDPLIVTDEPTTPEFGERVLI